MIKAPIELRDLRRRIYVKAKAEPEWRFWGLFVHVCKLETLREAYALAKRNDGTELTCVTCGTWWLDETGDAKATSTDDRLLDKLEQARQTLGKLSARCSTYSASCSSAAGRCATCCWRRSVKVHAWRAAVGADARGSPPDGAWLEHALDPQYAALVRKQDLLDEQALAPDAMDATRVQRVREELERAAARRLQPHYRRVVLPCGVCAPGRLDRPARAAPLRDHPRARRGAQSRPADRRRRAGVGPL